MMFRSLLFTVVTSLFLALNVFAADEITHSGSGYVVNACQINGNQIGKDRKFKIYNQTTGSEIKSISHQETTGENQCVNWTISPKKAKPGDVIVIEVAKKSGGFMKGAFTVPKASNTSPGGGLESCDNSCMRKMYDRAKGPARQVVNIIAENNFPVANALRSYQDGFYDEFSVEYCRSRTLRSYPGYDRGFQSGMNDGGAAGFSRGESDAQNQSDNYAMALVEDQFKKAIPQDGSSGSVPARSFVNPGELGYQPPAPNVSVSSNLSSKISREFRNVENYLKSQVRTDYGWDMVVSDSHRSWFTSPCSQQRVSIQPWTGRWAFDLWQSGRLTGASEVNYYKNLPSKYSNGRSAQDRFRSEWIEEYNTDLEIKYRDYMRKPNRTAYTAGVDFARDLLIEQADEEGYVDGYTESYMDAAFEGFNSSIGKLVEGSYDSAYSYLSSNGKLEGLDVSVKVEGLSVGVLVSNGANVGGAEAEVTVSIQNSGKNKIVNPGQGDLRVPALSQIVDDVFVGEVATFMETVDPDGIFDEHVIEVDREYPVNVRVGQSSKTMNVKLTVVNVAQALESESSMIMKKVVMALMEKDWNARKDGRFTNSNNNDSYVEQLLGYSRDLSRNARATVREAAKDFKDELPGCNWLSWCTGKTKKSKEAMEELIGNF